MTPEQQQIAIAEACGWKETEAWLDGRRCFERADSNAGWDFDSLPDYLNDLNAMHAAERMLWDFGDEMEFTNQLVGIVCSARGFRWDKGTQDDHLMCLSHATASQRAEAFLRTIGKWEESK